MSQDNLNENFLIELLSACFRNKTIFEICVDTLQFHFLPEETYKKIWKSSVEHYRVFNSIPTIGIIAQKFQLDEKVISSLDKIKNTIIEDKEALLDQFEKFIKRSIFMEHYTDIGLMFNDGKKEGAYLKLEEVARLVNEFSLRSNYYETVFSDFEKRNVDRILSRELNNSGTIKCPTGIDPLDELMDGGIQADIGDMILFLAESGVGKSTILKWMAISNARIGRRVVHIQLEGTKKECLVSYDQAWTGSLIYDIERGEVDEDKMVKLKKIIDKQGRGTGEIYVYAFEQFNSASCLDIKKVVEDIEKNHGKVDLVIIDYLELLDPADGIKYSPNDERHKRLAIANKLKNIAVSMKLAIATATQASDLDPKMKNNPSFKMTRHNISEAKGLTKPFSAFFTINQTLDEKEIGCSRIYPDKIRKYKSVREPFLIASSMERHRFYDKKKTLALATIED